MRGRTLDDSFIILDEAQNTSREQMKMFLTRMGFGSKVVITGDVTQIDLPTDKVSGLKEAMKVLRDVEGVAICRLTKEDVVRHVMVQRIIESIAKMKDGVVIINTSRGTNVDEAALLAGLESGKVRAAGLDVYADEPATNKALYSHSMVSCTPHIGAATVEAQKRIGAEIVDIISKM